MRSILLLVLLSACGDDDGASPDAGGADAGVTDGGGSDGGLRPEDVPAVPLGGDPSTACPAAFATAPVEGLNEDFPSGGQMRDFVLGLPPATFSGPRPLFVGFNGTGESGPTFYERADLDEFVARGFVVLAPSSIGNGTVWPVWDGLRMPGAEGAPNLDVDYVNELIACVGAHFEIDRNRVYAGGHSAGGIFANAYLQRRSDLLAGGIVASGVFDLSSPVPAPELEPMFVIVTWGGDNDEYSNPDVPSINFVEQASIASHFYEDHGGELNCHYDPGQGHRWLDLNDWMIDRLLEHPKGLAPTRMANLPAPTAGITCSDTPYSFVSPVVVTCPASETAGCQAFCQYTGDCAVENATVSGVVGPQLAMIGFSGEDRSMCEGCVSFCEDRATMPADAEVLTCFETATAMTCGGGASGFVPWVNAVNSCCMGRTDSTLCVDLCTILVTNELAAMFVTECDALAAD
jgi:predicted esterase